MFAPALHHFSFKHLGTSASTEVQYRNKRACSLLTIFVMGILICSLVENKIGLLQYDIAGYEIISMAVLPLPLIKEGQLSVTDTRRCTSTG